MKLHVTHVSDTHGFFPELRGRSDIVIHSGDFMPNRFDQMVPDPATGKNLRGIPHEEGAFQTEWIDKAAPLLKNWLGGRSFIFCAGNHDYIDPVPRLRAEGIDARNITSEVYDLDGVSYIGFPFCPYDVRPWKYAVPVQVMQREVARLHTMMQGAREEIVLVAHCPPAGILDSARGTSFGNTSLTSMLTYECQKPPIALLCGHVHEDHGVTYESGMLISNAATTSHNLVLNVSDA